VYLEALPYEAGIEMIYIKRQGEPCPWKHALRESYFNDKVKKKKDDSRINSDLSRLFNHSHRSLSVSGMKELPHVPILLTPENPCR
jgi:hypothetical protein